MGPSAPNKHSRWSTRVSSVGNHEVGVGRPVPAADGGSWRRLTASGIDLFRCPSLLDSERGERCSCCFAERGPEHRIERAVCLFLLIGRCVHEFSCGRLAQPVLDPRGTRVLERVRSGACARPPYP
eukprot:scaffold2696_cov333-Pavlova_lutheri.AAC.22